MKKEASCLLHLNILIIITILTVGKSNLTTANSIITQSKQVPDLQSRIPSTVLEAAQTKNIAERTETAPNPYIKRRESPPENCTFQPEPLALGIQPISVITVQFKNRPISIQVIGSTVLNRQKIIDSDEIKQIIQRIKGINLTDEQFREIYAEVVSAITQLYLNEGYISSKAIFQEPLTITNLGVVEVPVIEGHLAKIQIAGRKRLNLSYLCSRIKLAVSFPLNIVKLEGQLRLIERNSLLDSVAASLKDTGKPGSSILIVAVREADSFTINLSADNYSPPSLGSERLGIALGIGNVTGLGDGISATYYNSTTGGAKVLDVIYQIPLNPREGKLQLRATSNWTKVTQEPLDEFDITGKNEVYEISYRQPLTRTLQEEFALSWGFRYQDGQTFVADRPAFFGASRTSVIQVSQDYTSLDSRGVWFLRSQFNFGTGLFNATTNDSSIPDGRFFVWSAQVQRGQRLGNDHLLIIQGDLQLTPDSLLPDYLFIVGGGQSVRGYRQNIRSGDNGFRFSIEDRITVLRDAKKNSKMQIAPFLDLGAVWNASNNPNELSSQTLLIGAGLGLIWEPFQNFKLQLNYGFPFINLQDRGNNLQDNGFYFEVNYQL